ncbi:hypothetical protein RRG08_060243 [Elysia crispata]|uniref:Uncharacterized protein n=1 Tax=Elysia crispata TaxID=231223 RepID=A0AAE0ZVN5_9GAST|nr:hypothetical protein RRG08_060243 [Elysia crispata]
MPNPISACTDGSGWIVFQALLVKNMDLACPSVTDSRFRPKTGTTIKALTTVPPTWEEAGGTRTAQLST